MKENISQYSVERIDDCLRRVIRRHQTSRSSSGIVYLALAPAGGAQNSLGGLGTPRFCRNNNVNLSPRFPLVSSLSFFLSFSRAPTTVPVSIVGDNLPGTQKELTTWKGNRAYWHRKGTERPTRAPPVLSSIMRPVGRGEPFGTVFVRSAEHNIITWTHSLLTLGSSALYLTFSLVVGVSPSLLHLPVFVLLLIPECFWDLLIGNINRMHERNDNLG